MSADSQWRDSGWFTDLLLRQESDYPAQPRPRTAVQTQFSALVGFLALGLVGLALAGVAVRFTTTKPELEATRNGLADRVEAMSARVVEWNADNAALAASNARLIDLVLPDIDGKLADQVKSARRVGGFAKLAGPGVVITLENVGVNKPATEWAIDTDLQVAVNGLFAAGAQGVAVNGLRITPATSIRGAGGNILVDYQPVTSPYRIVAIGKKLLTKFGKLPARAWLDDLTTNYSVDVRYANRRQITLPAGTIPSVSYAERIEQ